MARHNEKIWLFGKFTDLLLLGAPVWFIWIFAFSLPTDHLKADLPLWVWVVFVLGIDVSHVWSTLFRTYLDKEEFVRHKSVMLYTPILCLVGFFIIGVFSISLFWTILAYIALYHFIKQQFGFMQLYRARFGFHIKKKWLSDKFIIYLGMLYPVWYWHLNSDRDFSWFVDGDFINFKSLVENLPFWQTGLIDQLNQVCNLVYFALLLLWIIEEIVLHIKAQSRFPIGKWLWVLTTWFNWFLGIVYFNSDIVFTVTNVIAHGVPYMVLTFFYIEKKRELKNKRSVWFESIYRVVFMLVGILILAFSEEYLWDMLLYRDNVQFFDSFLSYPLEMASQPVVQALLLAILTLPQATHYVLDGFIWKANKKNPDIKPVLLG